MTPDTLLPLTRHHPLLSLVPEAQLRAGAGLCRHASLRPGRPLCRPNPAEPAQVHFLLRGSARLFHREPSNGRELLLVLLRAPAVFGDVDALSSGPRGEHCVSLEPCEVLSLPAEFFRSWMAQSPRLALAVASALAERVQHAWRQTRALAYEDVPRRVAQVLLDYATLAAKQTPEGLRVELRLTQERLAADIGASRKSLQRALTSLMGAGLVRKLRGRYLLPHVEALQGRLQGPSGPVGSAA